MVDEVAVNKHGQVLGEKGAETRRRLMEATRCLLNAHSPMELTPVVIAKKAETSPSTFYIYFDNIKDIMYALAQTAEEDTSELYAVLSEPWDAAKVEVARARRLVGAFCANWERHRAVLLYRNLEADSGDSRFVELRTRYYYPIVELIGIRILAGYQPNERPRMGDAYAEAASVYAALERTAATDPITIDRIWGTSRHKDALARVIAHVLGGRAQDDTWVSGNSNRTVKKTAKDYQRASNKMKYSVKAPADNVATGIEECLS